MLAGSRGVSAVLLGRGRPPVTLRASRVRLAPACMSSQGSPGEPARLFVAGWDPEKEAKARTALLEAEGGGVVVAQEACAFDHAAYLGRAAAEDGPIGHTLLTSPWVPSTHNIITDNFGALPLGTMCVADRQGAGRGRGGNVWESPLGCLMFSFSASVTDGRTLPFLQYVVSLAVVEAVEAEAAAVAEGGGAGGGPIDVRIKWPNDIYGRASGEDEYVKLGGLLCTSTYADKTFRVVVGVGINVDNAAPTTCLNALLPSASPAPGGGEGGGEGARWEGGLSREGLLAAMAGRLGRRFQEFVGEGFDPMRDAYLARWMHSGQRVTLEEGGGGVGVTIQGLSSSGFLLAVGEDDGATYELHPDGNSLDFFKGLVRKKTT